MSLVPEESGQEQPSAPIVSVVIPTRGRAELLKQCLESIFVQTLGDIEVIVVVDGPDPATIDLLANIDDPRLEFVALPESRGVSNARNTGIGVATARWVAFCDDDDLWDPTKLAAQLATLAENPAARWVTAGAIRIDQDAGTAVYPEPASAGAVAAALPHSNLVPGGCSGVVADRRLVLELGGFDPRLSMIADRDLWIRLNRTSAVAVAAEPLVGYRDHRGAMSRRIRRLEDELDVLRDKYRAELAADGSPFPADVFYVYVYRRTFRTGDWKGGVSFLVRSPRFRVVLAKWLWSQAKGRLGLGVPDGGLEQPPRRTVTVAEFPWLAPVLGRASDSSNSGDMEQSPDAPTPAEPAGCRE